MAAYFVIFRASSGGEVHENFEADTRTEATEWINELLDADVTLKGVVSVEEI